MKNHLSALINSGLWTALDWVFPPECAACGEPGDRLCSNCQGKIHFLPNWREDQEGVQPLVESRDAHGQHFRSASCSESRHLAYYEGVIRECIHSLKYHENRGLGAFFAKWLARLVDQAGWVVDLVMPVPLSEQRFRQRGYNQSSLIARPLAFQLGIAYNPYGLRRILDTPSQVGLSAEARRRNVAKAFLAEGTIVKGKSVLLVDDVMTTGSTLNACADALVFAGAVEVYAVTIGRHIDRRQLPLLNRHHV